MEYSSMLRSYIEASGKSQNKIAAECAAFDVSVSPAYVSKLKNGRHSPPSDKVNIALAKVLGCDPGELLLASYRTKMPGHILDKLVREKGVICKGGQ